MYIIKILTMACEIIYLHKFKNVVNFRISLLASLNKILKEFIPFSISLKVVFHCLQIPSVISCLH